MTAIINPYMPDSMAHKAWEEVRRVFLDNGRNVAESIAREYDRNIATNLAVQVRQWSHL